MDGFPAGLRVLVVDDDPTWVKILEKMLKKCTYEVTTCCKARAALDMLRERKDGFDIVISDVNMPDMDGFKLLEHVGLEMDLPVIMMSVDGETSRVMKGVQHGACDYLLKPIRLKELQNIWQHVLRKKVNELKDIESHDYERNEYTEVQKNVSDDFGDEHLLHGGDPNSTKKRKEVRNEEHDDQALNNNNLGAAKKARVVWSVDLHKKFVNAVNQIGFDKAGPKKILDLMNVPRLTRENVASHLQKYRLYLSRLQKQNEQNTSFCGIKHSDFSSKDHGGKFGLQSLTARQHSSPNSLGYSSNKSIGQDVIQEICDNKLKSILPFLPITEAKNSLRCDVAVAQKVNTVLPQLLVVRPFGGIVPDGDDVSLASTISQQQSWSGESSVLKLMQHVKQDHEPYLPLEGYPHFPLHSKQHHYQVDREQVATSANATTYISETDKTSPSETKRLYTDYKSNHVRSASSIACRTNSSSVQLEHNVVNQQGFGAMPISSASSSTKNLNLDRNYINAWESHPSLTTKNGSFLAYEDLQCHSLQSYGCSENIWPDNMEFSDFQTNLYDGLMFNCDYQCDSMEYPIIDEGVFIA